jgi:hypothetical protein
MQGLLERVGEGGMMVEGACASCEVMILEFGALGVGMVEVAEDADCDRREV